MIKTKRLEGMLADILNGTNLVPPATVSSLPRRAVQRGPGLRLHEVRNARLSEA